MRATGNKRLRERGNMVEGVAFMLLIAVAVTIASSVAHRLGWHVVARLAETGPMWLSGGGLLWVSLLRSGVRFTTPQQLLRFALSAILIAPAVLYAIAPDRLPVHPYVVFVAILVGFWIWIGLPLRKSEVRGAGDVAARLSLVKAAAGALTGLDCPDCARPTVRVSFTHPTPDEYRTWFVCSSCDFEMRTKNSGRPSNFSESLVDQALEGRDQH